jgi:hypothetical protein
MHTVGECGYNPTDTCSKTLTHAHTKYRNLNLWRLESVMLTPLNHALVTLMWKWVKEQVAVWHNMAASVKCNALYITGVWTSQWGNIIVVISHRNQSGRITEVESNGYEQILQYRQNNWHLRLEFLSFPKINGEKIFLNRPAMKSIYW